MELATRTHKLPVSRGSTAMFAIAIGSWPTMVASLLFAVAGDDDESRLSEDLRLARRLAMLLGEDTEAKAALSRLLFEPPGRELTVPYVEVELAEWRRMRASMLTRAVEVAGSIPSASIMLDIPAGKLRRELRRDRRTRSSRHRWWSLSSPR